MFNVNKWGLKISQFWPRVVKKQYVTRFHDITGYSSIICTHIVVNRNLLCISCHLSHFRGLGLGLKYVDTTIKTTKYYGGSFCNFLGLMDLSSIFFKKTDFNITYGAFAKWTEKSQNPFLLENWSIIPQENRAVNVKRGWWNHALTMLIHSELFLSNNYDQTSS